MTIGFRILKRDRVVPDDIVAEFAKLPVANVSDSMSRMTAAGPGPPAAAALHRGRRRRGWRTRPTPGST